MRITQHALEHYLERVLNISLDQAGEEIVIFALEQIELAVRSPELTYQHPSEQWPVHVRNGCAVPVIEEKGIYVPTTYQSGTFIRKFVTHEPARAEG